MTTKKLTLKHFTDLMDKTYTLTYIDYRDSFDENLQPIQDAITAQDYQPINDQVFDQSWYFEGQWESIDYIIKENIIPELLNQNFTQDQIDEFIEENRQEIEDELYKRDDSTPIKDLLRNTADPVMFYELNFDISWSDNIDENTEEIRKFLNLPKDKYNKELYELVVNAYYGGNLVIYFRDDPQKMIETSEFNTIEFKNPTIALIDLWNGSGSDTKLMDFTITLPYDPKKVFIDKLIKYNYTYEVCGMTSAWCDSTQVKFLKVENQKPPSTEKTATQQHLEIEKQYNETFKAGSCTYGDMDMKRHRDTFYLNEYPCGTHCPHCNMFWID